MWYFANKRLVRKQIKQIIRKPIEINVSGQYISINPDEYGLIPIVGSDSFKERGILSWDFFYNLGIVNHFLDIRNGNLVIVDPIDSTIRGFIEYFKGNDILLTNKVNDFVWEGEANGRVVVVNLQDLLRSKGKSFFSIMLFLGQALNKKENILEYINFLLESEIFEEVFNASVLAVWGKQNIVFTPNISITPIPIFEDGTRVSVRVEGIFSSKKVWYPIFTIDSIRNSDGTSITPETYVSINGDTVVKGDSDVKFAVLRIKLGGGYTDSSYWNPSDYELFSFINGYELLRAYSYGNYSNDFVSKYCEIYKKILEIKPWECKIYPDANMPSSIPPIKIFGSGIVNIKKGNELIKSDFDSTIIAYTGDKSIAGIPDGLAMPNILPILTVLPLYSIPEERKKNAIWLSLKVVSGLQTLSEAFVDINTGEIKTDGLWVIPYGYVLDSVGNDVEKSILAFIGVVPSYISWVLVAKNAYKCPEYCNLMWDALGDVSPSKSIFVWKYLKSTFSDGRCEDIILGDYCDDSNYYIGKALPSFIKLYILYGEIVALLHYILLIRRYIELSKDDTELYSDFNVGVGGMLSLIKSNYIDSNGVHTKLISAINNLLGNTEIYLPLPDSTKSFTGEMQYTGVEDFSEFSKNEILNKLTGKDILVAGYIASKLGWSSFSNIEIDMV